MKIFLWTIAICFYSMAILGQTPKIDGLKQQLHAAKTQQSKLKAIISLCDEYETLPKDTLWNYALRAKKLAAEIKDTRSRSFAVIAQAHAYLRWDNTDSAKMLVNAELEKCKPGDAANRDIYFKLLELNIDCTGDSNNYKDAIDAIYDLMSKAEKYKDSVVIAESMNTLCAFNYDMNFLNKSREWGYKALSYTSNTPKFYSVISGICHNMGDNYWWVENLDSAAYFVDKDIDLSNRIENLLYLSRAYEIKSNIYVKQKNYALAEQAMLTSIAIIKKVDGSIPQPEQTIGLAAVYRSSGQIDKSIEVLKSGLVADSLFQGISPHAKKSTDDRDLQKIFYYQSLAKSYRLNGDSKNYEACLEKIIVGKDAFYEANSAQAIADYETKYKVQKNQATIARQQLDLVRANYLVYGSALVAALGGIIALLLFRDFRTRQKRLSARAVADAEDTERRRIAADLHDNLGAQLSFIKRNVNFIMDRPVDFSIEEERKYLNSVNDIAQNAMIDLRETIWVLNKDEVNIQEFADKLKSYLKQQLLGKEDIKWNFEENITSDWKLSSGEVMHLFRIVQEVISNIIKHSEAKKISILLNSAAPYNYLLEIFDDGKGFDMNTTYDGHYGLENIERRAKEISASLNIKTGPEMGTLITLNKN